MNSLTLHLESRKKLSTWSWCGTFGISVSSAKGMSHQPIQNSVALFWVHRLNTRSLISHKNFVKKFFVCINECNNFLRRCDSVFPLLRCQGVWNKMCTQLSLAQIWRTWGCSKILLSFSMQFDCHFWPSQQQQQCLPQFKSIWDGHLSSSSTGSLLSRNREYHLKTFDRFRALFP